MPLTTQSILRSERTLPKSEIDRLIDANLAQLEMVADREFKGRNFTVRDLVGSDLPGHSTNIWTETSSGSTGYATTTGGDNTAIADDTILMIWGISLPDPVDEDALTVTGFRFSIGASIRAQISVGGIITWMQPGVTPAGEYFRPLIGYFMTPIIVTSQTFLHIEEYSVAATLAYNLVLHGAVAEIQGKTLEA